MTTGLVIKSTGSWYTVLDNDKVIKCRIKGKFRTKKIDTTNPVTVGDKVKYIINEGDDTGIITEISERKNYIIRKSSNLSKQAHLLAANIDQALLMVTLSLPKTSTEFIDRFLLSTESFHIPTIILFNKTDLYKDKLEEEYNKLFKTYTDIGYKCISLSVKENENIDLVMNLMKNKLSLIAGLSGVGKTSLIKAINPSADLKTADVSDYHKTGKHTTTFSEIFKLNNDSYIIDTPGIKGFGIVDIEKNEIGLYFPEIFKKSKDCQFYNCTHIHEPGCAVIHSVESGEIASSRYKSYLSIYHDSESKYR